MKPQCPECHWAQREREAEQLPGELFLRLPKYERKEGPQFLGCVDCGRRTMWRTGHCVRRLGLPTTVMVACLALLLWGCDRTSTPRPPPDTVVTPPETVIVVPPLVIDTVKPVVRETLTVKTYQLTRGLWADWRTRFPQLPIAYAEAYDSTMNGWVILISDDGRVCPTKDYPPPKNPPPDKTWRVYCAWLP